MKNKEPTRRSSRIPKNNEESPLPDRKRRNSTPVVAIPKIQKKENGGRKIDKYCWICHQLGHDISCDSCPRVYHSNCIKKRRLRFDGSGFCECQSKFLSRGNDTPTIPKYSLTELGLAIQVAQKEDIKKNNQRLQTTSTGSKFWNYFHTWPENTGNSKLCQIIDLTWLIDRVKQNYYLTTAECFSDMKWIYHNCYILYGVDSEITETALKLEKKFKQELLELETCGECYFHKHKDLLENVQGKNYEKEQDHHANFFTRVCEEPHDIVWAKMRGSPYWPAKCMRIFNGHAVVSFFGTHDASTLQLSQCFRMSLKSPNNKEIKRSKYLYEHAIIELNTYVSNYRAIYNSFPYYPYRTPLDDSKKPHKRGWNRKRQSEKQLKDSSHSGLFSYSSTTIDEPSSSIKGLFLHSGSTINEPSNSINGIQTKLHTSLQHSSTDSSISPINCEMVCTELPSKRSSASEPVAVCMTFTTDDETDSYDQSSMPSMITEVSTVESSCPITSYSPVIVETPDFLHGTDALVQDKLNYYTETTFQNSSPHFINSGSSNSLPVITSVSAETTLNPTFAPKDTGSFSNETLLPEVSDTLRSISNLFRNHANISSSEIAYVNNLLGEQGKDTCGNSMVTEDDDDVVVLKQDPPKESKAMNSILSNTRLAHSLSQLLISNKPHLQEFYKNCIDFGLESFLRVWLALCLRKQDESEVIMFLEFYSKVSKANEALKEENLSLKEQNLSFKDGNLSLKEENLSLKEINFSLKEENSYLRQENESLKQQKESLKEAKECLMQKTVLLKCRNEKLQLELEAANTQKVNAVKIMTFMNKNSEKLMHGTQQLETVQLLNNPNLKEIGTHEENRCEIENNLLEENRKLEEHKEQSLQLEDELKSVSENASCTNSECQTTLSDLPDSEMCTVKEHTKPSKDEDLPRNEHTEVSQHTIIECRSICSDRDIETVAQHSVTEKTTTLFSEIEEDDNDKKKDNEGEKEVCPSYNPNYPQVFEAGTLLRECSSAQSVSVVSSSPNVISNPESVATNNAPRSNRIRKKKRYF